MNKKDKLRNDLKIAANMLDKLGYVDEGTVLDNMGYSLEKVAQTQQPPMGDMNSIISNSAQGAVSGALNPDSGGEAVETADIGLEAAPAASDDDITDMMVEISGILGKAKLELQKKLAEKGIIVDYASVVTLFNKAEQQIVAGVTALLKGEQIGASKNKQRQQNMGQQSGQPMDMNMGGQQGNNFFANAGEQQQQ